MTETVQILDTCRTTIGKTPDVPARPASAPRRQNRTAGGSSQCRGSSALEPLWMSANPAAVLGKTLSTQFSSVRWATSAGVTTPGCSSLARCAPSGTTSSLHPAPHRRSATGGAAVWPGRRPRRRPASVPRCRAGPRSGPWWRWPHSRRHTPRPGVAATMAGAAAIRDGSRVWKPAVYHGVSGAISGAASTAKATSTGALTAPPRTPQRVPARRRCTWSRGRSG